MFSPDSIKFFFAAALCAFLGSSCGWRAAKTETQPAPFAAEELKSGVPFSTAEPENFQAEFVITANGAENKIFVARSGNRRRTDYNSGAANQLTILQTGASRKILVLPDKKIYAEDFAAQAGAGAAAENFTDFLTSEWLNNTADARFTRLGAENDLTQYAVRLDDSDAAEAIVFVDERVNLPVRQEFYSLKDGRKILIYAVEMKNFKAQADEKSFDVPADARKVSVEILRAAMREEKTDGK